MTTTAMTASFQDSVVSPVPDVETTQIMASHVIKPSVSASSAAITNPVRDVTALTQVWLPPALVPFPFEFPFG